MKADPSAYRIAVGPALVTLGILLIPLSAMQFSDQVNWGLGDFVAAGALLFGTGLAFKLVARKSDTIGYRAAVGVALAAALLLVWANLAVGIIGSEDNPANLMYLGVLAVGTIGAIIARFEAHGMARALFATALAQASVAAIALLAGEHLSSGSSALEILIPNGVFVALFAGSASLFLYAARKTRRP